MNEEDRQDTKEILSLQAMQEDLERIKEDSAESYLETHT